MAARPTAAEILDAALELARSRHWEEVRLADVAERLSCRLGEIHSHYPDKEALVDAWWDRADAAMLAAGAAVSDRRLVERVETLVFTWIGVFAVQRETAWQMLMVRLEPGHLHIQVPSLLRISKTVQWLREAAGMHEPLPWRAIDETAMTSLFVATVMRWLYRGDEKAARELLRKGLEFRPEFPSGNHLSKKEG